MKDEAIETGFRMALETNAELLGRVPIFEGLSPEQVTAIANRGKKTFFAEGAPIVKAGDKGDTSYLVLTGLAATEPEAESGLEAEMLEPGTLVGELAMLVENTHTLTVKAKVRVRALAITRADLYELMEADPSIAHHFSQKLVARLAELATDLRRLDTQFAAVEFSLAQAAIATG
jgi:CRP/FNR family transcriptional regulator, cyclic AMP receptor protein